MTTMFHEKSEGLCIPTKFFLAPILALHMAPVAGVLIAHLVLAVGVLTLVAGASDSPHTLDSQPIM